MNRVDRTNQYNINRPTKYIGEHYPNPLSEGRRNHKPPKARELVRQFAEAMRKRGYMDQVALFDSLPLSSQAELAREFKTAYGL